MRRAQRAPPHPSGEVEEADRPRAIKGLLDLPPKKRKSMCGSLPACRTVLAGSPRRRPLQWPSERLVPFFLGAALVGWCQTMNMAG